MVVESFPNFLEWIGSATGLFALICLAAVILGVFAGYIVSVFRHGPFEAFYVVAQVIGQAIPDFLGTSIRRTYAMARLAIKEALRRRVILVTFLIFCAALLAGVWFVGSGSDHPDQVYVNFVLWGTQLLVLMVALLISAFSLPEDIKKKTIYTIVTKPVRSTEIVLGRILGFGALCTALLALMGIVSFFFVWRGLSHTHLIVGDTQDISSFVDIDPNTRLSQRGQRVSENCIMEAETTREKGHYHRIELIEDIRQAGNEPLDMSNVLETKTLPDGRIAYHRLICDPVAGHTHLITVDGEGDRKRIRLGPAVGYFRARVPVYAKSLVFHDRDGTPKDNGISVGREWEYRGYIDGGSAYAPNSLSKAVFTFKDFDQSTFTDPDILPLEMTLSVFRTFIADVEKRVTGSIKVTSIPDNAELDNRFESDSFSFETEEYSVQTIPIPRKLQGRIVSPEGNEIEQGVYDIFDDFAANNQFQLSLVCEDRSQYIGVARADLYFRATDSLYWWNFIKGYLGIWCQMMVIIAFGVALSTFLSSPITIVGVLSTMVVGFFTPFIRELTDPDVSGGGPIESMYRLVTQKNMESVLEPSIATTLMEQADKIIVQLLNAMTYLVPDFSQLNFTDFLTYGYSVDVHRVLVALAVTFAFCLGLSILGYFSLKTREIAK